MDPITLVKELSDYGSLSISPAGVGYQFEVWGTDEYGKTVERADVSVWNVDFTLGLTETYQKCKEKWDGIL